jgi:hypothetical protein
VSVILFSVIPVCFIFNHFLVTNDFEHVFAGVLRKMHRAFHHELKDAMGKDEEDEEDDEDEREDRVEDDGEEDEVEMQSSFEHGRGDDSSDEDDDDAEEPSPVKKAAPSSSSSSSSSVVGKRKRKLKTPPSNKKHKTPPNKFVTGLKRKDSGGKKPTKVKRQKISRKISAGAELSLCCKILGEP